MRESLAATRIAELAKSARHPAPLWERVVARVLWYSVASACSYFLVLTTFMGASLDHLPRGAPPGMALAFPFICIATLFVTLIGLLVGLYAFNRVRPPELILVPLFAFAASVLWLWPEYQRLVDNAGK